MAKFELFNAKQFIVLLWRGKSEVDALQQLCLRAGVRQKDINTCSPNKSKPSLPHYLLLTDSAGSSHGSSVYLFVCLSVCRCVGKLVNAN